MDSLQDTPARVEALSGLSGFRADLRACFTRRGDALFELADAMLCAQGPVRSPVELCLEPEFRRRHGSVYEALARGRISSDRLRHLLAGLSAPARAGEPLMFAIDITPLARPDAQYAGERTMVQVRGKGGDRWLPGWPYSLLVGIQWGSSSWVDPIEARRLWPGEEHTDVTISQITGLLKDLTATGKQQPGDPPLVLLDARDSATDLTHALAGHDVQLLVRLRSTRVFYRDPAPRRPGQMGAPPRHGAEFSCSDPARRHTPDFERTAESGLYGTVTVRAWTGLHQKLGSTGRWASWPRDKQLPIVRGTVLQVVVGQLPDGRKPPKDLWRRHAGPSRPTPTCSGRPTAPPAKNTSRPLRQVLHLGLASAHLSSAAATDRWVTLAMGAYAQLRLARHLVDDLRRPWHPRPDPGKPLSPCKVRLGFRRLRARIGTPAGSPKPARPGPGRPKGSKNRPKSKRPPYRKSEPTTSKHEE